MINLTEEVGRYFGYPVCCIHSYEDIQSNGGRKTAEQSLIAAVYGGGFIPCQNHAIKVLAGEISLDSLIQNRICEIPFPDEPPIEVIDDYLSSLDGTLIN